MCRNKTPAWSSSFKALSLRQIVISQTQCPYPFDDFFKPVCFVCGGNFQAISSFVHTCMPVNSHSVVELKKDVKVLKFYLACPSWGWVSHESGKVILLFVLFGFVPTLLYPAAWWNDWNNWARMYPNWPKKWEWVDLFPLAWPWMLTMKICGY